MSRINVDPRGDRGGSGINVVAIITIVIFAFLAVYLLSLGDMDVDAFPATYAAFDRAAA